MDQECERQQLELLMGKAPDPHLDACSDCASFYAVARELSPPDGLVRRTLERLQPSLRERAALRRKLAWRLSFAGFLSLPVILAINAGIVWLVHEALASLVSPDLAIAGAAYVAASLLLSVSLAYGALPLLASWGLQLRKGSI